MPPSCFVSIWITETDTESVCTNMLLPADKLQLFFWRKCLPISFTTGNQYVTWKYIYFWTRIATAIQFLSVQVQPFWKKQKLLPCLLTDSYFSPRKMCQHCWEWNNYFTLVKGLFCGDCRSAWPSGPAQNQYVNCCFGFRLRGKLAFLWKDLPNFVKSGRNVGWKVFS